MRPTTVNKIEIGDDSTKSATWSIEKHYSRVIVIDSTDDRSTYNFGFAIEFWLIQWDMPIVKKWDPLQSLRWKHFGAIRAVVPHRWRTMNLIDAIHYRTRQTILSSAFRLSARETSCLDRIHWSVWMTIEHKRTPEESEFTGLVKMVHLLRYCVLWSHTLSWRCAYFPPVAMFWSYPWDDQSKCHTHLNQRVFVLSSNFSLNIVYQMLSTT